MSAGVVSSIEDRRADHYLGLDASLVATDALLRTKQNLLAVIGKRAMMCLYGDSGLGKTLSVNACLREIAPTHTVRVEFSSYPSLRDVRNVMFEALELTGRPPRRPFEFNQLLLRELSQEFLVLVCDEAQWLSRECFELYRFLWDNKHTKFAIIFVGGDGCYRVLRNERMLASRIYIWQGFRHLTDDQVLATIPAFHPIWENADPADILYTNKNAAHGNFRAWALITTHIIAAMSELGRTTIDRELLRAAFDQADG